MGVPAEEMGERNKGTPGKRKGQLPRESDGEILGLE